jgi:transcriptional regulator with XRE-family HTH domain
MLIGQKLKTLRTAQGLSCEELALRADVPVNALFSYERGGATPSLGTIQRLARCLGVSLSEFDGVELPLDARRKRGVEHRATVA